MAATTISIDVAHYRQMAEEASTGQESTTFNLAVATMQERGVQSDEDYTTCLQLAADAGRKAAYLEEMFKKPCQMAHDTHKSLTALRGKFMAPFLEVRERLNGLARQWHLEQQAAKRAAEQQIANAQNRGRAQAAREAELLMAQGFVREAQEKAALVQQPAMTPILPAAVPKVSGVRTRDRWRASCTDILALAAAVVAGKVPLMQVVKGGEEEPLLVVNQKVLNALVDRLGPKLAEQLPGVQVVPDVDFARR